MPQVETLVSACAGGGSGDRKICCETVADGDTHHTEEADRPKVDPDFPPESFWLSKDEELDWWDRNAVYERKYSGKGNSSNSANLNPSLKSKSQRVSLKSKASIIGLPKPQKPSFGDAKNRRNHKPGNTRLFPKRSGSTGKSESSLHEPSSPKVSCMGRVRSRRDRNRRLRSRQRSSDSGPVKEKLIRSKSKNRKPGFFESFRAIFRSRRRENKDQEADLTPEDSPPRKSRTTQGAGDDEVSAVRAGDDEGGMEEDKEEAEDDEGPAEVIGVLSEPNAGGDNGIVLWLQVFLHTLPTPPGIVWAL